MKTANSNRRASLRHFVLARALVLAVAAAAIAAPSAAGAAASNHRDQQDNGLTTGLIGIVPGQTARLAVWNKGKESVVVRFRFVDAQGKVLVERDAAVGPGKAEMQDFHHPGGVNRFEFQAQFGTNSARQIGLLVPTLNVIDEPTGGTSWMLGPEDFTGFRLVPVPGLELFGI